MLGDSREWMRAKGTAHPRWPAAVVEVEVEAELQVAAWRGARRVRWNAAAVNLRTLRTESIAAAMTCQ